MFNDNTNIFTTIRLIDEVYFTSISIHLRGVRWVCARERVRELVSD